MSHHSRHPNTAYSLYDAVSAPLVVIHRDEVIYLNPAARALKDLDHFSPTTMINHIHTDGLTIANAHGEIKTYHVNTRPLQSDTYVLTFLEAHTKDHPDEVLQREAERIRIEQEQEMHRMRYNLMTTLGHELRTPLAVILAATELLERYFDRLTPEKRSQYLARIKAQIEYLKEMLRDINYMIHRSVDEGDEHSTQIDLKDICNTMITKIGASIGMEYQIVLDAPQESFPMYAKAHFVNRIIFNLLSNAIKYSTPNTTITVRLRDSGREYLLDVIDEGEGIDENELPNIFKPWHGSTGYSGHNIGLGLGLAVVQEYVNKLGGIITVSSEVGKGSTFTVVMPYG